MGRKTDAMHNRYRIVNDQDKRAAMQRTEQHLRTQVLAMPTAVVQ
jgi:hypothetical protein